MHHINDNWDTWQRLLTMLENQFGNKSEFILHDLTKDYNHTIVDIRNGYITNRKIGDCGSNLGLEVLRGSDTNGDRFNYIVHTRDGKLLRSSTMYFRDQEGRLTGSLCINTDITETVHFEEYLRQHNRYSVEPAMSQNTAPVLPNAQSSVPERNGSEIPVGPEIFANDISQILDYLIQEAGKLVGKPVDKMNREDKIKFVRYLDRKGAFLITKASERVYEHLGISRYTLYNYLDQIHKETDSADE